MLPSVYLLVGSKPGLSLRLCLRLFLGSKQGGRPRPPTPPPCPRLFVLIASPARPVCPRPRFPPGFPLDLSATHRRSRGSLHTARNGTRRTTHGQRTPRGRNLPLRFPPSQIHREIDRGNAGGREGGTRYTKGNLALRSCKRLPPTCGPSTIPPYPSTSPVHSLSLSPNKFTRFCLSLFLRFISFARFLSMYVSIRRCR